MARDGRDAPSVSLLPQTHQNVYRCQTGSNQGHVIIWLDTGIKVVLPRRRIVSRDLAPWIRQAGRRKISRCEHNIGCFQNLPIRQNKPPSRRRSVASQNMTVHVICCSFFPEAGQILPIHHSRHKTSSLNSRIMIPLRPAQEMLGILRQCTHSRGTDIQKMGRTTCAIRQAKSRFRSISNNDDLRLHPVFPKVPREKRTAGTSTNNGNDRTGRVRIFHRNESLGSGPKKTLIIGLFPETMRFLS